MSVPPVAQPSAVLSEIFAKISMGELPAMSQHAQELRTMTSRASASNAELVRVILKDYALTCRILQAANSAYYAQGRECNTVSKAVATLGFNVVKELAQGIALFEDFVRAGVDKEAIQGILARSYLAGLFARRVALEKKRKNDPEEVFLCALFYNLGKVVICLYQPVLYRDIESAIETGSPEARACRDVLDGLTYYEAGIEVARFWNLPVSFTAVMEPSPPEQREASGDQFLVALTRFANDFVDMLCDGSDFGYLFDRYESILLLRADMALALIGQCVTEGEAVSLAIKSGLAKLKIAPRLRNVEINIRRGYMNSDIPSEQGVLEIVAASAQGEDVGSFLSGLRDQEKETPKTMKEYLRDLVELTEGELSIRQFYTLLVEAFHRGLGFDRAILASINALTLQESLVGRFGAGDLGPDALQRFEFALAPESQCPLSASITSGKDLMIAPDKAATFPAVLRDLVRDRTVYLFPICIDGKGVSMIYLDRKANRPVIDKEILKAVRQLRDLAVSAIVKIRAGI